MNVIVALYAIDVVLTVLVDIVAFVQVVVAEVIDPVVNVYLFKFVNVSLKARFLCVVLEDEGVKVVVN